MIKKQIVYSIQIILFLLITNLPLVFADTIILKSGKRIEGKITEKTDKYIKLDINGLFLTFWLTEVERIEAETPPLPKANMHKDYSKSPPELKKIITEIEEYLLNKKYEDALLATKKAIELDPTNHQFYFALGIIYYYLGNSQESISSFQKAMTLNHKKANCYLCLGIVYDSIGLQKEAKEALIESIELCKEENSAPGIFIAEAFLKKIISKTEEYFLNKKYEDALLATKKAIELDPTNHQFYFALGIIYYYLGNSQESISSFQKAMTLNHKKAECYLCLGIVYDSIGLQKEAKEALIESIKQSKEIKELTGIFIAEAFLKKIMK